MMEIFVEQASLSRHTRAQGLLIVVLLEVSLSVWISSKKVHVFCQSFHWLHGTHGNFQLQCTKLNANL